MHVSISHPSAISCLPELLVSPHGQVISDLEGSVTISSHQIVSGGPLALPTRSDASNKLSQTRPISTPPSSHLLVALHILTHPPPDPIETP